ncbi:MAG: PEP-CTERM sorting domain-containing protein [Candidatus Solibacter usitatus]|nr:PEP-CTERM sorting domain-containing protein [Candidatus Solibacter usitatus]
MFRLSGLVVLVALSVVVPCFADICGDVSGNLVANCGFETGSFSSWTTDGLNNTFVINEFNQGPNSGAYFAALGNVGSIGTISQTLSTVIGQSYNISFYFSSDGGTPNSFAASFGSDVLYSATDAPASGYQLLSFTETATSTSTVLSFSERNDPSWLGLDDITVTLAGLQNFGSLTNSGLTVDGDGFEPNCFPVGFNGCFGPLDPTISIRLGGRSEDINGAFTFAADANGNISSEFVDSVTGINDILLQTPLDPAQLSHGYTCTSFDDQGGILFPACGFRINPDNPALLDILFDGPDIIPTGTHFTISGDGWVLPAANVVTSPVPEPASWVLLVTVAAGLIGRRTFVRRSRS